MPARRRGVATLGPLALTAVLLTGCAAQNTSDESGGDAGAPVAVPGFDPDAGTITVGQITALSGPVATSAADIIAGQQAYYDRINAEGGIDGKYQVELITGDNQYNPQLAVQAYQRMQSDVVMLSNVLGTPSVQALIPILEQNQGLALGAQDASLRTEAGVVPFLASYQTDVINAVSYLYDEGGVQGQRYCALIQDDESGQARVAGLEHIAEELDLDVGEIATFAPTDTAFTAQVQALQDDGCDVVVFGGAANNVFNVVAAATQLQYEPTWIAEYFANSTAFPTSPIVDYLEQNWVFTGPGDQLDNTDNEGIANLVEDLQISSPDAVITLQHVYGYIQAQVTAAVLEQAVSDGDLSGAGLRQAITEIDSLDFEGLQGEITYGAPEDRVLPHQTTVYRFDRTKPFGLAAATVLYEAPEGIPADF